MKHRICPRCEQGFLYVFIQKDINQKMTICDECDAIWLANRAIQYGVYGQDFYDYSTYMKGFGINGHDIWQQENMFATPLLEFETT